MRWYAVTLTLPLLAVMACGDRGSHMGMMKGQTPPAAGAGASTSAALTPFEQENGIGPITETVPLGPVDQAMAKQGEGIFEASCSACHKLDERYVGPPLGQVLEHRTPAYVMNMILNPEGMYSRHPEARALLAQYATQMPNMGLSQDQARAIVEYFRLQAAPQPSR